MLTERNGYRDDESHGGRKFRAGSVRKLNLVNSIPHICSFGYDLLSVSQLNEGKGVEKRNLLLKSKQ